MLLAPPWFKLLLQSAVCIVEGACPRYKHYKELEEKTNQKLLWVTPHCFCVRVLLFSFLFFPQSPLLQNVTPFFFLSDRLVNLMANTSSAEVRSSHTREDGSPRSDKISKSSWWPPLPPPPPPPSVLPIFPCSLVTLNKKSKCSNNPYSPDLQDFFFL